MLHGPDMLFAVGSLADTMLNEGESINEVSRVSWNKVSRNNHTIVIWSDRPPEVLSEHKSKYPIHVKGRFRTTEDRDIHFYCFDKGVISKHILDTPLPGMTLVGGQKNSTAHAWLEGTMHTFDLVVDEILKSSLEKASRTTGMLSSFILDAVYHCGRVIHRQGELLPEEMQVAGLLVSKANDLKLPVLKDLFEARNGRGTISITPLRGECIKGEDGTSAFIPGVFSISNGKRAISSGEVVIAAMLEED